MTRWMTGAGLIVLLFPLVGRGQGLDPSLYVHNLYRTILQRDPSRGEVELWARRIVEGLHPDEVRAAFLGSDEFFKLHDRDPRRFVIAVFVLVHGRPGSHEELKHWGDHYWAQRGDRVALGRDMIRASHVVVKPLLPAEPVAVPQPNQRLVAQAEIGVVLVELFLNALAAERSRIGVAGLEEQARALGVSLNRLRTAAAQNAAFSDLRYQFRLVQDDTFRLRERHRHLGATAPSLRLPSLVEIVDAVDALGQFVTR